MSVKMTASENPEFFKTPSSMPLNERRSLALSFLSAVPEEFFRTTHIESLTDEDLRMKSMMDAGSPPKTAGYRITITK